MNTISQYIRASSDYGWITNRNSNDIHPASPGCRPGTYPLIEEEAEEELQTRHSNNLPKQQLGIMQASKQYATATQHENKRHGHDVQIKRNKT